MLLGGGIVVAGAIAAAVALWPSGGGSPSRNSVSPSGASPSPTVTYPLSQTPRTIPAVREHVPARGPGWRPAPGARVVVGNASLDDEGRLLAGELGMTYAGRTAARDGDVELGLAGSGDQESYTMTVQNRRVRITGPGDAGVFYGTRTLKQEVHGGGTAPEGVVRDAPAEPRRGFMIDIARKYYTAGWIEDRVRELGDLKYNELGLHFSDDQGFRIESSSHPEIVSQRHLSKAEVKRIVDLAASRHITVVPEIDSPGHLGAVIAAHPDLQLRSVSGAAPRGALDISKPAAAKIVDDLLDEFAGVFPGAYWHLGGDEYRALTVSNPAASYPQLAAAARAKYGANAGVADLATGWLNDRADVMRGHSRTTRAWNDGFYRTSVVQPAKDLEVAYWTGKELGARQPAEYLGAGRKVINYNDEFLYYVLGQPQTFVYPTGQRIYERWNPRVLRGTTEVPARYDGQILGGVFAVWSDRAYAQTQDQVAAGIRMPLRATAQKLWDPRTPALSWTQFLQLANRLG
ncbi:glycoside hydrolase family 20 protein [Streptomyces chiangmaiensis]|uniref:Glycoside hydrolase family 20 protein n=1 Tax=Streptomyces chiangmaiensis TaxID=766497 RepID=A0ABU7FPT4_9ACTN|nr:glycoside hydrolase family 20 protein [Streptomyces chiangmaiensis]MED7825946.1 glycoside hydrolase family 20 protein [Streptomyces chiangmaiensis]